MASDALVRTPSSNLTHATCTRESCAPSREDGCAATPRRGKKEVFLKTRFVLAAVALTCVSVIAGVAVASGDGAPSTEDTVLIYNGPAIANTHAEPTTPAFTSWCSLDGPCSPSVQLPMFDASTGERRGQIYVWTKNFVSSADGNTICFGEFIWFDLSEGSVYVHSGSNGTCGGFMDPSLKPPTHIAGAGQVIGGGGDGIIVGGTGKYGKWTGTYTDRVFVEFNFSGGANYYDQLFFSIHRT